MSCPQGHLIIRLVGGELTQAEAGALRHHLATCQSCAAAFEELTAAWDDLGAWNIGPAHIDLTDRVLAQAADQETTFLEPLPINTFNATLFRVAASVALAAGLGISAAALLSHQQGSPGSGASSTPTATELAESLGLAELATQSATGLPLGFEPDDLDEGEVEL